MWSCSVTTGLTSPLGQLDGRAQYWSWRLLVAVVAFLVVVNVARADGQTLDDRVAVLEQVTGALNQENAELAVQLAEADQRIDQLEARIATLEAFAATQRAAIAAFTTLSRPSVAAANQRIARKVLAPRGWHTGRQWGCVRTLWQRESGWDHHARNPRYTFGTGKVGDLSGFASALLLLRLEDVLKGGHTFPCSPRHRHHRHQLLLTSGASF